MQRRPFRSVVCSLSLISPIEQVIMPDLFTRLVDGQPRRAATYNAPMEELETAILARQGAFAAQQITTTLTSDTSTITINLAVTSYPTLVIVASLRSKSASVDNLRMRFNGDVASTYAMNIIAIDAGATYSNTSNAGSFDITSIIQSDSAGAGQYTFVTLTISQAHLATTKMIEFQAGRNATPLMWWGNGYWPGAAVISQVSLFLSSGSNFATGSTYALYGMQ